MSDTVELHEHEHEHAHLHVTAHAHGRRHVLHDVLDLGVLVLIGLALWYLWPAALGGNTRFIIVQGKSMEPVYHIGDTVIVDDSNDPRVGQIIVFHIPKGEPAEGMMVVHRVHAIRPDGSYETKGDNRSLPDPFHVTRDDIVGMPEHTLPQFGRLIIILGNPFIIGGCAGLITLLWLWPRHHHHADVVEADVVAADGQADDVNNTLR